MRLDYDIVGKIQTKSQSMIHKYAFYYLYSPCCWKVEFIRSDNLLGNGTFRVSGYCAFIMAVLGYA